MSPGANHPAWGSGHRPLRFGLLLLGAALLAPSGWAARCQLSNIIVDPVDASANAVYSGREGLVEITLNNTRKADKRVVAFADTPLTIVNRRTGKTCVIEGTGGSWSRNAFFTSADGQIVLAHEFTGSYDYLNFYSTKTCQKVSSINVSNATFDVVAPNIEVLRYGAGAQASRSTRYGLTSQCVLPPPPKSPKKPAEAASAPPAASASLAASLR